MYFAFIAWSVGCAPLDNIDPDGDGYSSEQGDCAPLDPTIYPGVRDCPVMGSDGCLSIPGIGVSGPWDGHYAGSPIEWVAQGLVSPELTLEQGGETISGTLNPPQEITSNWVFAPTSELLPATTYTWKLHTDTGCEHGAFTTSSVGLPVTEPQSLVGRTFEVAVDQRYADVTFMLFFAPPFWVRIDRIEGDVAEVTIAPTKPPGSADAFQYYCEATQHAVGSWDGASIQLSGERLRLPVGTLAWSENNGTRMEPPETINLNDWRMELVVHPDGTAATLDHFTFTADTRPLGAFAIYGPNPTPGGDGSPTNFCSIASALVPIDCGPCEDDVNACVPMELVGHRTSGVPVAGIVGVDDAERENHRCPGACQNGIDDDEDGRTDSDDECTPPWPD